MPEIDPLVRAERSKQILDDPLVREAFAGVEAGLVSAMKQSAVNDETTHHHLVLSLQALGSVRREFEKWIAGGQVEEARRKR